MHHFIFGFKCLFCFLLKCPRTSWIWHFLIFVKCAVSCFMWSELLYWLSHRMMGLRRCWWSAQICDTQHPSLLWRVHLCMQPFINARSVGCKLKDILRRTTDRWPLTALVCCQSNCESCIILPLVREQAWDLFVWFCFKHVIGHFSFECVVPRTLRYLESWHYCAIAQAWTLRLCSALIQRSIARGGLGGQFISGASAVHYVQWLFFSSYIRTSHCSRAL